jgi:biotin-(acetyl-CoA carboxylase) ligase
MAAGRRYSRAAIVQALLEELERGHALLRQDMPDEIINAWRKLSPSHCGTPVTVTGGPSGTMRGVTRGLDDDGALLVERADGQIERIAFGEIRRIRGGRGPATRP